MAVVLFTNDLRAHDHAGLDAAARAGEPIIGLYAFDPLWDGEATSGERGGGVPFGFRRMAPARARFLIESVAALRARLAELGIPLVVRRASTEEAARELLTALPGVAVHMMAEHGTEEIEVRRRVREAAGGRLTLHEERNLVHPDDLPFPVAECPDLFAHFRREVERAWRVRDERPIPRAQTPPPLAIPLGDLPSVEELTGEPALAEAPRFPGGEAAALARLERYFWEEDRLREYKVTRNGMLADDDSSKFGPYLSRGCVSPRRVYGEIRRYERERVANESTGWLVFELLWRDFFGIVLMRYGARFFHGDGLLGLRLPTLGRLDAHLFRAWAEGRTGIPIVDAAQREMRATGFQSNRARQNVASVFIKNLRLDWRLGAAWFERHLLCHDPASNTGNWLYLAGIGNDGRMWRIFNPTGQGERYDPEGEFAAHWLPELRGVKSRALYDPPADVRMRRGYPAPIVDLARTGAASKAEYLQVAGLTERGDGSPASSKGGTRSKDRRRR